MGRLLSAAKDVAAILRGEHEETRRTLVSYMKLLAVQAAPRPLFSRRGAPKKISLFGHSIEYLDPVSLSHMVREIFIRRHYLFETDQNAPTIVDAGANIGLATLFIKQRFPRARIIAFEPDPLAFAALQRNIRANALQGVIPVNKAVAGRSGSAALLGHPESLISSLRGSRGKSRRVTSVETVLLSNNIDE
jgi:FkbM family methyltransferase